MKTVVITGSARGLGYQMAKCFLEKNVNVVISDVNEENLKKAEASLSEVKSKAKVASCPCNVTNAEQIKALIAFAKKTFGCIDIWVNNAGVNQPDKAIWELSEAELSFTLDVDLKGSVLCSNLIMQEMIKQGKGAIYNMEGHGSNDNVITGLSIYGTSKRAITYFTTALAKESAERKTGVLVGKLSPGIMITDFLVNAMGDKEKVVLPEKTKQVYNILGDYPDVIAAFMVKNMLKNKKNNKRIMWLTNRKAGFRFMTAAFNKRDFFKDAEE